MSATQIESIRDGFKSLSLDDYLSDSVLGCTLGDLLSMRASAPNAKAYFVANVVCSSVMDMDIGVISEIVKRIDGTAATKERREGYSNIFSDALEDVLDYEAADKMRIYPSDPAVIALAKAVVAIANFEPGKNMQARKDRQKAIQMIFDRIEGRRSEPAKSAEKVVYSAPSWMGLPKGEDDGNEV